VVAATHLKAQRSEMNELIRCRQVEELLAAVDLELQRLMARGSVEDIPVILLGDLNADPPSQMKFECSAIENLLKHNIVSSDPSRPIRYRSAYHLDDASDGFFTSWKIRGCKDSKRIIDYIFYAGFSIQCTATLKGVAVSELERTKLPGLRHPSDHLQIGAKLEIR
jgi:endonuclease/exonuclease/phosphatase family metal-dependent hydrolase